MEGKDADEAHRKYLQSIGELPDDGAELAKLRAFVAELRRMSATLPHHEVGENVEWLLRDLDK